MNEELKIIISASVDKLKSGVESAKKEVSKLQDKFKEAAKTIKKDLETAAAGATNITKKIAGGVAALGAALVGAAVGTEEYRNQQAQLKTAFEEAGASAETATETYNGLYRVLGDGGQAQEAAQHLAKLTNEEKALNEWTNICQGVFATFGASLPIEGLTEAVNHTAKLGEVQGSLADALEWSGISVDAYNEQLAACNTEAEREKLIRETLSGLYSEAAATYEANNAQILAQRDAQAALQEKLAAVGEAIAPVITAFTTFAAEVLEKVSPIIQNLAEQYLPLLKEWLEKAAEAVGKVITWVVDNWELISTIATVILSVVAAFTALDVAMKVVNAAMALFSANPIVLAIGAVIAIFVLLWTKCEGFREFWQNLWAKAKELFNGFVEAIKPLITAIVGAFKEAWELIKVVWDLVKPYFETIWNNIKIVFGVVKDVLGGFFKAAWDNIKVVWGVAVSFFTAIWNTIKGVFAVVKNVLSGNFKDAWEAIKGIFSSWGSFFTGLWNSVKQIFSNVAQAIGNAISSTVKGAVNAVLNTAAGIINGFISAINLAIGIINAIPGVNIRKLNKLEVPQLAKGGVVDSATLAVIGEQGKEMVMPLENNLQYLDKLAAMLSSRMGGGSRPIVLQIDGKTFAQTTLDSINNLTRQTGKLGLTLV